MIDDILTMSKMRSKELTLDTMEVDLVSLAQQSVLLMNTVKGDKNLSIVFNPSVKEVEVSMDFQMIERVINNILNNAIKYAPKDSELLMDVNLDGDYAKLSITDWGKGIPKAHHQKIFELFSRVDPNDKVIQGTGLGLAFCKLAIEAHLGEIFVESPVPDHDCGSRFSFKLPLSSKIEAAKKNS